MKVQAKYRLRVKISENKWKYYKAYDLLKFCDYLHKHFLKWQYFRVYVGWWSKPIAEYTYEFRPKAPREPNTLCHFNSEYRK